MDSVSGSVGVEESALPLAPGLVYEAGSPSVYVAPSGAGSRRLELRLVVKVGSSHEEEGERGFAIP